MLSSFCLHSNAQILDYPSQFEQLSKLGMCSLKIHTQYSLPCTSRGCQNVTHMYLNSFLAPHS